MTMRIGAGGQQLQIFEQEPVQPQEEIPVNPPQEDATFLSSAKKLMQIVLKHQDKRDPLSNKLFMQGSEVALFVINARSQDLPRNTLISHFLGLKAIFSDECHCETVNDVWLVGTKAWEKKELDLYCNALSHHAPRVVRSIDLGAPHVFGNEVLHWIKDLERPIALLANHLPHLELAFPTPSLIINELGVPVVVDLEVRDEDLITTLTAADPDEPIDIHTANRVLSKFNKRMDSEIIERKKVQFTEDLKKQNALYKTKLDAKNNQFDIDLARQAESNKGHVEFLANSLNKTVSNFTSALNERTEIVNALTQGLEKCEKELNATAAEVANQKIEIRSLKESNYWLNQRVGDLQNQVDNMDDGCVIS